MVKKKIFKKSNKKNKDNLVNYFQSLSRIFPFSLILFFTFFVLPNSINYLKENFKSNKTIINVSKQTFNETLNKKQNNKNLDYKSKLLEELEEEIGINKNQVKEIFEICVVKDKINSVYDICCIIKLRVSKSIAMKNIRKTAEYTTPKFVKIKDIPEFITRHNKNIVPTTLGLLEYYSLKN